MLSTVEKVYREIKKTKEAKTLNSQTTDDATFILRRIDALWRLMEKDQRLKNSFVARIDTEYFDAQRIENNGPIGWDNILYLTPDAPLLSLTSLEFNDANDTDTWTTVDSDNILLLPRGNQAKTQIKLLNSEQWPFNTTVRQGAIRVTGEWAYHDEPDMRWLDSNDSLVSGIDAAVTELTVNSASGADYWLDTPRFSPGQLLKVDSEYMYLRLVSDNTLSIMRGQRGSAPAAHDTEATIYIWSGIQAAQDFVTRASSLQYRRRGEFIDTKVEGVTEIHYPTAQTMPEYKILLQLNNVGRMYSA